MKHFRVDRVDEIENSLSKDARRVSRSRSLSGWLSARARARARAPTREQHTSRIRARIYRSRGLQSQWGTVSAERAIGRVPMYKRLQAGGSPALSVMQR